MLREATGRSFVSWRNCHVWRFREPLSLRRRPDTGRGRYSGILLWLALTGCSQKPATTQRPIVLAKDGLEVAPASRDDHVELSPDVPDYLHELRDVGDWDTLAAASQEHAIAQTEVVKVLWDHATNKLYFMQSQRWPLHYEFAKRFIEDADRPLGTLRQFGHEQYGQPNRTVQAATLVQYPVYGSFIMELGPADNLSGPGLVALYNRVLEASFFGRDLLSYRPRSTGQETRVAPYEAQISIAEPNSLWRSVMYHPVTLGEAVGRLRIEGGAFDPSTVSPDEILVLDHVPSELPVCAGLITGTLPAPLSHVAVLSQSRATPAMFSMSVTKSHLWFLQGHFVRLRVERSGYSIEPATEKAHRRFQRARALRQENHLNAVHEFHPDLSRRQVTRVCDLRIDDSSWAGAKAAQLGEVCGADIPTAGGFVVPLAHFFYHLESHQIELPETSGGPIGEPRAGSAKHASALLRIRRQIEEALIEADLLDAIVKRLAASGGRRWIFRSSSNAEDLPGFSGAGLYRSVVTSRSPPQDEIATAVRRVWSSTYLLRSWNEARHANIPPQRVGMAVIFQPVVEPLSGLGVAVTENPYSQRRSGILVNLAAPGQSVTASPRRHALRTPLQLPEQILLYRHSAPELLSRSTATPTPILKAAAMKPLRDLLDAVHDHMLPLWGGNATAADIEFALRSDQTAVILQARPYRLANGR